MCKMKKQMERIDEIIGLGHIGYAVKDMKSAKDRITLPIRRDKITC